MNKTILVVDDSNSIRESVSFFLEQSGFNTIKAVDGVDALSYISNQKFDLVLTDLHMPNMNGIELIKAIRKDKNFGRIPIILLTTETLQHKKLEAKKAGATGWLNKPFDKDRLLKVISKVLR